MVSSSKQLIYGNNNHSCSINGVSASYLDIRKYELKEGVMFTEEDVRRYSKVCVIGQTVVKELFTNGEDPIGKTIRFGSIPMTVMMGMRAFLRVCFQIMLRSGTPLARAVRT